MAILSVLLLLYSVSSDALGIPGLLLSYFMVAQKYNTNNNPSITFQPLNHFSTQVPVCLLHYRSTGRLPWSHHQ